MKRKIKDSIWSQVDIQDKFFFKDDYESYKKGDIVEVTKVYSISKDGKVEMFIIIDKQPIPLDKLEILNKKNIELFKKNL